MEAWIIADRFLSCLVKVVAIFYTFFGCHGVYPLADDANIYPKASTMQNKVLKIKKYLTLQTYPFFN